MNYENVTTCDVTNGDGVGVVLWVSGCDVQCQGCQNKETWIKSGKPFTRIEVELIMKELERPEITRFTVSGGHPLMPCNRGEVKLLLKKIKSKFKDKIKIWLYTGYVYEEMDEKCKEICDKYCDVIVDGPYIEKEKDLSLPFRGSRNQRIIYLTK